MGLPWLATPTTTPGASLRLTDAKSASSADVKAFSFDSGFDSAGLVSDMFVSMMRGLRCRAGGRRRGWLNRRFSRLGERVHRADEAPFDLERQE